MKLDPRIARLEKALRFYANPKHWRNDDWGVRSVVQGGDEYGNPGEIARRALRSKTRRAEGSEGR